MGPQESVWTTGDGVRDEGFMMYLKKMNLELYQKHWEVRVTSPHPMRWHLI